MSKDQEERMLQSVGTLLSLFTVNEERFPSAEGQIRYNPIDFQTLRYVDDHPGCRGVDIARAIGVAPTTLQSALDRMIRNGIVERVDHPTSRRAKAHRLTKEGQKIRGAIHRQDLANMRVMLDALSPKEQTQVMLLLEKIVSHLGADN